MHRLSAIAIAAMLLFAVGCVPQGSPLPTVAPVLTDAPLLPNDATSTPDGATLQPTVELTEEVLLPVLPTPEPLTTTDPASLATPDAVIAPDEAVIMATPTDEPGMVPMVSFDPTPTIEVLVAQAATNGAQAATDEAEATPAEIVPLTPAAPVPPPVSGITADLWRSTAPAQPDGSFTGEDVIGGTLTVPYPSGWQTSGDANGLIITNADATALSSGLSSGQVAIYLTIIPNDLAPLAVAAGFEPSAPLILANFIASTEGAVDGAQWGQVFVARAGTRPAGLVTGSNGNDDALIVSVQLETGYALLTAVTDQGGLPDALPVMALMARSLEYNR